MTWEQEVVRNIALFSAAFAMGVLAVDRRSTMRHHAIAFGVLMVIWWLA